MISSDIFCAFSGGGYRATFFHAGVLRKLIDFGLKDRIRFISSVSGGSIVNALFGIHFDEIRTLESYDRLIIDPLIEFSKKDIRDKLLLYKFASLLNLTSDTGIMVKNLDKYLFKGKTLADLSENIQIVINATNLNNGLRWQFDNYNFGDDKTGFSYDTENIPIALAVTSSACFPGLFSPIKLDIQDYKFYYTKKDGTGDTSPNVTPDFVYLADGGIFDNLGYFPLEQACEQNDHAIFIVSDAASRFKQNQEKYHFLNEAMRIIDILMEQVGSRDRRIITDDIKVRKWQGFYMKLEESCRFYRELGDDSDSDADIPKIGWHDSIVERIAQIRTDLNAFSDSEIQALICHGETLVETITAKRCKDFYRQVKEFGSSGFYADMPQIERSIFCELEKSKKKLSYNTSNHRSS